MNKLMRVFGVSALGVGAFVFASLGLVANAGAKDPVAGMRLGSDYQKPGAPVRFSHNYDGRTEVSESETIELRITPEYDLDELSVQVSDTQGLLQKPMNRVTEFAKGGDSIRIPVTVSAHSEGRYFINVFVKSEKSGQKSGRSFALPIVVGDAKFESAKPSQKVAGENLQVFQADETIR